MELKHQLLTKKSGMKLGKWSYVKKNCSGINMCISC